MGVVGGWCACAVKPSLWLELKALSEGQERDKRSRICAGLLEEKMAVTAAAAHRHGDCPHERRVCVTG